MEEQKEQIEQKEEIISNNPEKKLEENKKENIENILDNDINYDNAIKDDLPLNDNKENKVPEIIKEEPKKEENKEEPKNIIKDVPIEDNQVKEEKKENEPKKEEKPKEEIKSEETKKEDIKEENKESQIKSNEEIKIKEEEKIEEKKEEKIEEKKETDLNSLNSMQLPQIKISEKKTQAILEESGMLDAYKYLIIQLCKNGFPTTNLFEYSAFVIKNNENERW